MAGSSSQDSNLERKNAQTRKLTLTRFKTISQVQITLALILVICGIIGAEFYDSRTVKGVPYFSICFFIGPMLLVASVFTHCFRRHGKLFGQSETIERQIHCDLRGIHILSPCLLVTSFVGAIMTLTSSSISTVTCGGCDPDEYRNTNRVTASITIATLAITFFHSAFTLYSFLNWSSAFGYSTRNCGSSTSPCKFLDIIVFSTLCANRREEDASRIEYLNQIIARHEQTIDALRRENEELRGQRNSINRQFERLQQRQLEQEQQRQQQQQQPPTPSTEPPPSYTDVMGYLS